MLTYELKKSAGVPLYEALYRYIRADILAGRLSAGEHLPSKRALAAHLEVSKITVESAYAQLLAEGYIRSVEKVGFFVEDGKCVAPVSPTVNDVPPSAPAVPRLDLTGGTGGQFPFSVWSKLQREVMLDYAETLLLPMPNIGVLELREAIAQHLADFHAMRVAPEQILVGAGGDFLYNLLIQLLGRERVFAVEEPVYGKIRKIYASAGARVMSAEMDGAGVVPASLEDADVAHLSPSHHFPTGLVTPLQRRKELIAWAHSGDKWLIEDDYDSEFRFDAHPMPTLFTLDGGERVVYMNSFSKSLAPSIRISYLVLPRALMARFQEELGFYSCTVPSFEQYTLARFLSRGYFEKHINRMRKVYRSKRNAVISLLNSCKFSEKLTIMEQDAGLHFLLRVATSLSDAELVARLDARGVRVRPLTHYCHANPRPTDAHTLVINYAGADLDALDAILRELEEKMQ